jgi:hypothetical protein
MQGVSSPQRSDSGPTIPERDKRGPANLPHRCRPIDKATWVAWRISLGVPRKQALKLWEQYGEWLAQEALQPRPRVLCVQPWQNWEREFRAFLDEMPRKPVVFLAMVKAAEKRRAQKQSVEARKAHSRERYRRQFERRSVPS